MGDTWQASPHVAKGNTLHSLLSHHERLGRDQDGNREQERTPVCSTGEGAGAMEHPFSSGHVLESGCIHVGTFKSSYNSSILNQEPVSDGLVG